MIHTGSLTFIPTFWEKTWKSSLIVDMDRKRMLFNMCYFIIVSSFIKQLTVVVEKLSFLLENRNLFTGDNVYE